MADAIGVAGELQEHLARDAELEAEPPPVVEILLGELDHRGRFAHGCPSGQGSETEAKAGRSTLV
jgi:hypothetical protein